MEVRNSCFAAFIDFFTQNTYVMVIMSDPTIRKLQHIIHWGIAPSVLASSSMYIGIMILLHIAKLQPLYIITFYQYFSGANTPERHLTLQ